MLVKIVFVVWHFIISFLAELKKEALYHLYKEVELPFSEVLSSMEEKGILLDTDSLGNLSSYLAEKIAVLEKEIHELAGEEFKVTSPKQLQVILYEKLKIQEKIKVKNIKKTKTGLSTDVNMLTLFKKRAYC